MKTAIKPTTVRLDANLKERASEILDSIGLSYNSFVVMATHQLVNQRRIPFEILPALETPNDITHRALIAAEAKELRLIPDDSKGFADVDELMSFLDGE